MVGERVKIVGKELGKLRKKRNQSAKKIVIGVITKKEIKSWKSDGMGNIVYTFTDGSTQRLHKDAPPRYIGRTMAEMRIMDMERIRKSRRR